MRKIIIVLFSTFSFVTLATDYQDIQKYNDNYVYKRGSYITYQNNIWVARHRVSSIPPSNNKFSWAKVNIKDVNAWKKGRTYLLGKSVIHNEKMYFSKSLWPIDIDSAYAHYKWVEFSHPATEFDIPNFDPESPEALTIIGTDTNNNNIRDDYELKVIMSDKPTPIKKLALKGGEKYQDLMKLTNQIIPISPEVATEIMIGLILAERCRRKVNRENPEMQPWKKGYFLNTFDRIKQNRLLQNKLYRLLQSENLTTSIEDPCLAIES